MAKAMKKVRSVEVSKVKNGKKGSMHKVTTHFHRSQGKPGKGFGASMGAYHEPEDTFHSTAGAAKKHMNSMMGQMTASPEEEPAMGADNEPDEDVPA